MEGERHLKFIYEQKQDALTSYYLQEGEKNILPARVSFTRFQFAEVCCGGDGKSVGQFKATFKKSETSIYKTEKGTLHSNIYNFGISSPEIIGTGDIKGTNDLLVFEGDWKTITIYIFPDCKFKFREILQSLK
jgi:hypothetical protein